MSELSEEQRNKLKLAVCAIGLMKIRNCVIKERLVRRRHPLGTSNDDIYFNFLKPLFIYLQFRENLDMTVQYTRKKKDWILVHKPQRSSNSRSLYVLQLHTFDSSIVWRPAYKTRPWSQYEARHKDAPSNYFRWFINANLLFHSTYFIAR